MNEFLQEETVTRSLRSYCRNVTNTDGDTFVGIQVVNKEGLQEISVNFPIGYNISEAEENVREDIINLLSVLTTYGDRQSRIPRVNSRFDLTIKSFPIQAYLKVMQYFLDYGYYMETEEQYMQGFSGPISMKKTIQRITPIVQKTGFVYPTLIVRKNSDTDKQIITEINKYCVYESFMKLGWIYRSGLPQPSTLRTPNFKVYQMILMQKLEKINNDMLKQLFQSMLAIIEYRDSINDSNEFYYGTNKFEYIWEKLIDKTYGQLGTEEYNKESKRKYFPKTFWVLRLNKKTNAALEPDTIMITNSSITILDAKYYKYGITTKANNLPESTSINKQITYAEYIAETFQFEDIRKDKSILNAFLLPFNMKDNKFGTSENYYSIGEAVADWKESYAEYERVQGILVDVKKLMKNTIYPNQKEIEKLSKAIQESIIQNKK